MIVVMTAGQLMSLLMLVAFSFFAYGFYTARAGRNGYAEALWSYGSLNFWHRAEARMVEDLLRAAGLPLSLTSSAEQRGLI